MLMGYMDHHPGSSIGWPFTERDSGVALAGILAPLHLQDTYSTEITALASFSQQHGAKWHC